MSWALSLPKPSAASLRPGVPPPDFVRQVALFGIQNRDGWGVGLTIPAALGNLLPVLPEEESVALLEAFDRQRQVDLAARLVARHLTLGHSVQALIVTLARALLREDAGFHAYQALDAAVRQFGEWGNTDEGRHILIAVARYLAAHSPTERAELQTAEIARRLMRGGELHREATAWHRQPRCRRRTLREAQIVIESWRRHFNTIRPHASFGYKPPAPEMFVPAFAAWPAALRQPASPAMLAPRLVLN